MPDLTADELAILDFEGLWWRHRGSKDEAIQQTLGTTPVRHYQRLTALLERPEVLAARPVLVGRLRRMVGGRRRAISAR